MKRIKMLLMAMVAVLAIGAAGATAASAGTFSAVMAGSTWAGSIGPCGFSMSTTGTPGGTNTVTANAASFTGTAIGGTAACDTTTTSIDYDVDIIFSSNTSASIQDTNSNGDPFEITDTGVGCTYGVSNNIAATSNNNQFGTWSGSGNATSSDFPCNFAPASVTISSGTFS